MNQHYHSTFGAVQESKHIFIENGFLYAVEIFQPVLFKEVSSLNILEVGFGTGLNAFLTQAEAEKHGIRMHYTAIEPFPLEENCWRMLNYPNLFDSADYSAIFAKIHLSAWNNTADISPHFTLYKVQGTLESYVPSKGLFHLVYFDAFSPDVQPELWTTQIFRNLYNLLYPGGILVTYSVKGMIVRALRSTGFHVEKLSGPPGKRHILRAIKI